MFCWRWTEESRERPFSTFFRCLFSVEGFPLSLFILFRFKFLVARLVWVCSPWFCSVFPLLPGGVTCGAGFLCLISIYLDFSNEDQRPGFLVSSAWFLRGFWWLGSSCSTASELFVFVAFCAALLNMKTPLIARAGTWPAVLSVDEDCSSLQTWVIIISSRCHDGLLKKKR